MVKNEKHLFGRKNQATNYKEDIITHLYKDQDCDELRDELKYDVVKVAHITFDRSTLVVPANELLNHIGDDEQNTYQVRFSTIRKSELEALPEFTGW